MLCAVCREIQKLTARVLLCVPAALRGVSAKLIIVEEAAHCKLSIYDTLVWPLLRVKFTVVILISSPQDMNSYVSQLMTRKHPKTGEYLFKLCSASTSCSDCMRSGHPECQHVLQGSDPPHLSSSSNEVALALYSDLNFARRELFAEINSDEEPLFKKFCPDVLHAMNPLNAYTFRRAVQVLYSFHDPNGNGGSNSTVWTWAPDDDGLCVCVGMDQRDHSESEKDYDGSLVMLRRHYQSLRRDRRYAGAVCYVAIEVGSNSDVSNRTAKELLDVFSDGWMVVTRAVKKNPNWYGVVTTEGEKRNWVINALAVFSDQRLRFAFGLIGANLEVLKEELLDELRRYTCTKQVVGPEDLPAFQKYKLSFNGKGGGRNDDMVTAMIACLWQAQVLRSDPHNAFRQRMRSDNRLLY